MINYHLTIYGRVQGVGFRWSTYQLAQQLNVNGIVKNQPNGSVYCEVQGDKKQVTKFISVIKNGLTPYAKIDNIDIEPGAVEDYQNSFMITR